MAERLELRVRWWLLALVGLVALVVIGQVPANASSASEASGTFDNSISPVSVRTADGNTFISFTFAEKIYGTLDGTRVGSGTLIMHPDGTINVENSGVFTGTVDGAAGSTVIRVSGSGTLASVTADFNLSHGTGGMAGIHGVGTVAGGATSPTSFGGTYSAEVNWSAS